MQEKSIMFNMFNNSIRKQKKSVKLKFTQKNSLIAGKLLRLNVIISANNNTINNKMILRHCLLRKQMKIKKIIGNVHSINFKQ